MLRPTDVTRRALLRGAAFGTLALASDIRRVFGQPVSSPPNIVFIMADDLGYADVACYGRPDLNTPNIDRIAANGVRFLQAYANSAVCSATRTALITGRYQYRLPLGLEEPLTGRNVGLPPEHPTLPSLLKNAGYATDARREMAPGRVATIWAAAERLRSFLRFSRRRHRLLHARRRRIGRTISGTTTCRCIRWAI